MRIIRHYNDFYDGVMAMDQDRDLVYDRRLREVPFNLPQDRKWPVVQGHGVCSSPNNLQVIQVVLGFCGRIYPILRLDGPWKRMRYATGVAYNVRDVDRFVEGCYSNKSVEAYYKGEYSKHWPSAQSHKNFDKFFVDFDPKKDDYLDIFIEHQVPIWAFDYANCGWKLALNPPLEPLQFMRIMDPYVTYQELCMFYGGMAQPMKEIPVPDNETMAEIKGHGGKYSFRKPPRETVNYRRDKPGGL